NNVTLQAAVTTVNRTVTQVAYYTGTTMIGNSTAAPYQVTWSSPAPGNYSLTAVATDTTGANTTSSLINVSVTGAMSAPVASPSAGSYSSGQSVSLSGPTGSEIRYTTDGSVPTGTSTLYSAPLTLTASTMITAKAFQSGWTPSASLVASYVITAPA